MTNFDEFKKEYFPRLTRWLVENYTKEQIMEVFYDSFFYANKTAFNKIKDECSTLTDKKDVVIKFLSFFENDRTLLLLFLQKAQDSKPFERCGVLFYDADGDLKNYGWAESLDDFKDKFLNLNILLKEEEIQQLLYQKPKTNPIVISVLKDFNFKTNFQRLEELAKKIEKEVKNMIKEKNISCGSEQFNNYLEKLFPRDRNTLFKIWDKTKISTVWDDQTINDYLIGIKNMVSSFHFLIKNMTSHEEHFHMENSEASKYYCLASLIFDKLNELMK